MSKLYQVLSILVVVIIFFLSFYYLQVFKPANQNIVETPVSTTPTTVYSMSGRVAIIKGNVITLAVTNVFVDNEGRHLVNDKKIVKITNKTKIFSIRMILGEPKNEPAQVSDIKVGGEVVIYSNDDISRQSTVEATRLDVLLK